jgi:hypothetical protein
VVNLHLDSDMTDLAWSTPNSRVFGDLDLKYASWNELSPLASLQYREQVAKSVMLFKLAYKSYMCPSNEVYV